MFNPGISTKTIRVKTIDLKEIYLSLENQIKLFEFLEEETIFEELA